MTQTHTHQNNNLSDAVALAIRIHESIDSYSLRGEHRIKVRALGQCLRSIQTELSIETAER